MSPRNSPGSMACARDVAHRRPSDDHGLRVDLRRQRHDAASSATTWRRPRRTRSIEQAGVGPEDIDVVELHDCFAHNELITYEALGLCPEGGAEAFIDDGDNTYGGQRGHQSFGRPAVERPSARRDGPCAVLRADAAIARRRRGDVRSRARGTRCSTISASAAPASSRSTSGCEADMVDRSAVGRSFDAGHRAASSPAGCAISSTRSARPNPVYRDRRSRRGGRLYGDADAADLSVLSGDDGRRASRSSSSSAGHRS